MKLYTLELKMGIEEHVPIVIHAEGNDLEAITANAEYSMDCPDPKTFHAIDNLSSTAYDKVVELFQAEISNFEEMRAEAQAERFKEVT